MTIIILALIILLLNIFLGLIPLYISQPSYNLLTIYSTFLIAGTLGGWLSLLSKKLLSKKSKTFSQKISRVVCVTIITLLIIWIPELDENVLRQEEWVGILFSIFLLVLPTISILLLEKIDSRIGFLTFGQFVSFILLLNFSTWLLIGKPMSLADGDKFVEVRDYQAYAIDTLYFDNSYSLESRFFKYVDDFRPSVIKKYNENLNRNFETFPILIDSLLTMDISLEETHVYFVRTINYIPFCLYMEHDMFAGSNSVGSDSYHFWLFKWVKLREDQNRSA